MMANSTQRQSGAAKPEAGKIPATPADEKDKPLASADLDKRLSAG